MCEYCDKGEVTVEPLDADKQEPCEWIDEDAGPQKIQKIRVAS